MQICRAEDGQVFQVSIAPIFGRYSNCMAPGKCVFPRHRKVLAFLTAPTNAKINTVDRAGSLELFLHQETGVDEEAVLAYLSDGRRLRNDNIRDLAGAEDQVRDLSPLILL